VRGVSACVWLWETNAPLACCCLQVESESTSERAIALCPEPSSPQSIPPTSTCPHCLACEPVLSSWRPRASNRPRPLHCLLHSGAAPPAAAPPPPYDDTATLRHTRSTTPFNVQPNPVRLNHEPTPSSLHPAPPPVSRNTLHALEAPCRRPKCLGSHVNRSCGLGAAHAGWRTGAWRTTTTRSYCQHNPLRGAFLYKTRTICVERLYALE